MIELIITPDHDSIELNIPESYIGKKVKVIYTIEETQENVQITEPPKPKKPSEFKKILSDELVEQYQNHIKKSREEWQNRIL